jgi:ComF family protein
MAAEIFCVRCRTPFLNDRSFDHYGVCRRCRSGLAGYDYAYSYGFYEGALRGMIHAFKYKFIEPLGEPLGTLMAKALPVDLTVDAVVPVPIHWRRKLWRGFNQAEVLARPLAHRLQVPLVEALRKSRYTDTQAQATPASRRSQLSGSFVLTDRSLVAGKRILLIDDVLTTGSTVMLCSRLLRDAGAVSITVLTLARVDRRPSLGLQTLTALEPAGGVN